MRAVCQAYIFGMWTMGLLESCCLRSVRLFFTVDTENPILTNITYLAVSPQSQDEGAWDSIHVFEAQDRARTCHYKLTSTVILQLSTAAEALGSMNLSGNLTRQVELDMPIEDDASHVANVGKLVEDMESKMRNLLQEVYFGKAKDVVGDLRSKSTSMNAPDPPSQLMLATCYAVQQCLRAYPTWRTLFRAATTGDYPPLPLERCN
jgi:hypothetical protein